MYSFMPCIWQFDGYWLGTGRREDFISIIARRRTVVVDSGGEGEADIYQHYLGGGRTVVVDGDFIGDVAPEAGVFHRLVVLLRFPIDVHVQHETTEGGSQVVR